MSKKQMVWHAYHAGSLCQYVDLEVRQTQIEKIKPEYELPTRRRLIKPVAGKLPEKFVTACMEEAAREVAQEAAEEAARKAWEAAEAAAWEAREAREAREASYNKYLPEIRRLHAIECPDCPWDGETIFSQ